MVLLHLANDFSALGTAASSSLSALLGTQLTRLLAAGPCTSMNSGRRMNELVVGAVGRAASVTTMQFIQSVTSVRA